MNSFNIVVALDQEYGIGKDGVLPWHLPEDLKHFKDITVQTEDPEKKNAVVMGRTTWESIPEKFRPLKGRLNIVLSRNKNIDLPQGVLSAVDIPALELLCQQLYDQGQIEKVFVIGGEQIFKQFIKAEACNTLYVTHILNSFECDTFFPSLEGSFDQTEKSEMADSNGLKYYFANYAKK